MKDLRQRLPLLALLLSVAVLVTGCKTLQEVANLRKVDFSIDRVADARLAGVDLANVQSYQDIGAADMLRLSAAIADREMPLSFTVHLNAVNPPDNSVNARMTKMDWTLLLEDKETISGTFDREVVLPPGEPTGVPIDVSLDLVNFFDDNLRELVNLALALGGEGEGSNVKLKARPTINTAIGPMRYPNEITIVDRDVRAQTP